MFFWRSWARQGRCWTGNTFRKGQRQKGGLASTTQMRIHLRRILPCGPRQCNTSFRQKESWTDLAERLLHRSKGGIEVYRKATQTRTRSSTQWELLECAQPIEFAGKICTVQGAGQGRQVIVSTALAPRQKQRPGTILEVLDDWGSMWMWKSFLLIGDDH